MTEHYFTKIPSSKIRKYKFKVFIRGVELIIVSESGVFSAKKLDKGTEVLAKYMRIEENWKILDLGCGYGVLGIVAAKLAPRGYVVLTDINKRAVKLAKINIKLNNIKNAEVRWGDLYEPVKNETFDTVVSNPPISAGLKVCYKIIEKAPRHLVEGGLLQIVARHKKGGRRLMDKMIEVFGNCEIIAREAGYCIYVSRNLHKNKLHFSSIN